MPLPLSTLAQKLTPPKVSRPGSKPASVDAGRVLSRGKLLYLGVRTKNGPLVTPVLYGQGHGDLWFVTRRPLLKAKLLRKSPETAWLVRNGDRAVAMRGQATLVAADEPQHWVNRTTPSLPFGLASWTLRNPFQVAGFLFDGLTQPSSLMPWEVVVVSLVATATETAHIPLPRATATPSRPDLSPELPEGLTALLDEPRHVAVGFDTTIGLVVVPGAWDPSTAAVLVPTALLLDVPDGAPACITVDEPVCERPTQQRGLVLRGAATISRDEDLARVIVRPDRVTFWDGFETRTVAVP